MDGAWTNENYFMVTNGLADMNGTPAETRQSITAAIRFRRQRHPAVRANQTERQGLVEDVDLTPVDPNHHLSLELDGGQGDLFKFKTGAPFVGFPPPFFFAPGANRLRRASSRRRVVHTRTRRHRAGLSNHLDVQRSPGSTCRRGHFRRSSSPTSPVFTHRSVDATTVFDTGRPGGPSERQRLPVGAGAKHDV